MQINVKPFDAAIFDLDGTLLDSMYVWARVDELFFERRGMRVPEDYGRALAGLSYRESAEYTIRRFGFKDRWEDLVAEWTELSREEYACRVPLKPGALQTLRAFRRAGIRLAVATALPEYLYRPCLERHGLLKLFSALCSTEETGGRGKAGGEVFLLAAERLGVEPKNCAVFEDVLEGIRGAKRAGMRAYCVLDDAARHAHAEIEALADGMIASYPEFLQSVLPMNARRCVIFTAHCEGALDIAYADGRPDDFILCADAGHLLAKRLGLTPDLILGDFDSSDRPEGDNVIVYPVMKDDPDTLLCAKYALNQGYEDFLLIGGFGGRLDHTLANLQTLSYLAERGARAEMSDGNLNAWAVHNSSLKIPRAPGKLSVFALGEKCTGVFIRGAKYPLEDAVLTPDFPIGMGNDFTSDDAEIGAAQGTLTILRERVKDETHPHA